MKSNSLVSVSGLIEATELLEGIEGVAFVRFESKDVVRHPFVARIIEAYDRGRAEKEG